MADSLDIKALQQNLVDLKKLVPAGDIILPPLTSAKRKSLREGLEAAVRLLESLSQLLGTPKVTQSAFDPTDARVVGQLISETLLRQDRVPLGSIERFHGSGVYAIYYLGIFDSYEPISGTDTPIYVGKVDPANRYAQTVQEQGYGLSRRLGDHAKSIRAASETLDISDFDCRFLVVKTAWESMAEDYLINHLQPVWNNEMGVCYGFGKHGDSAKKRSNTVSPWDTLHPGRPWAMTADNTPNPLGVDGIKRQIADHFARIPPIYPEKRHPRRAAH